MSAATIEVFNPYFSDVFGVPPEDLDVYGAFNISLLADLPLFIDPFLLFTNESPTYRGLHDEIVRYVCFLRDKAAAQTIDDGLLRSWFMFSEVRQTWLGFSRKGNRGSGLGMDFARALRENLHTVFRDFGAEQVTTGSHLEKLCLVRDGVGRDNVSDFTTNLITGFLAKYTETFAATHVPAGLRRRVPVERARFDYEREVWAPETFELPWFAVVRDYVLLTPRDILTRDETWINRKDLLDRIEQVLDAVPNEQLRAELNNYFRRILPTIPKRADLRAAAAEVVRSAPEIADYYIREKEEHGNDAQSVAEQRVTDSERRYIQEVRELSLALLRETGVYAISGDTLAEARERVAYLKHVIENQDGYRLFYVHGRPVEREVDIQILFRLVWFGTESSVDREVNNGRGPVDFKISRGRTDSTLVEFKLASNKKLKQNLQNQVAVYQRANQTEKALKVILFFSENELARVNRILKDLGLLGEDSIALIDARRDNKPSASVA
jgi:hypothetical protein